MEGQTGMTRSKEMKERAKKGHKIVVERFQKKLLRSQVQQQLEKEQLLQEKVKQYMKMKELYNKTRYPEFKSPSKKGPTIEQQIEESMRLLEEQKKKERELKKKRQEAAQRVMLTITNMGSPLRLTPHSEMKQSEGPIETKPRSSSVSQIVEKKLQRKYEKHKKIAFMQNYFSQLSWPFSATPNESAENENSEQIMR